MLLVTRKSRFSTLVELKGEKALIFRIPHACRAIVPFFWDDGGSQIPGPDRLYRFYILAYTILINFIESSLNRAGRTRAGRIQVSPGAARGPELELGVDRLPRES